MMMKKVMELVNSRGNGRKGLLEMLIEKSVSVRKNVTIRETPDFLV